MHIAITGGTGFLGRYLLRELAGDDHELRCWYRPSSDRSGLEDIAAAIDWQAGQMGDVPATQALVRGVDAVVHAALQWERSQSDGRRTSGDSNLIEFLDKNLMGSLRLFIEARAAGVERFVFISTCAVHEVILNDRPLDEAHPLWPTKHYGAHKAALEKFVHSFGLGQGWPICALRPTGIYGLDHPASRSRWFDLVGRVVRGEPIQTERGGKEVHARDVARAVSLLLGADEKLIAGRAFNCYDMYIAEQKVAQIAKRISGSSSSISDLNRGPKNQIQTGAIRALGMTFGGDALLEETVAQLVRAQSGVA
jgi:nucleoside-diphosphate-sugar epimerase